MSRKMEVTLGCQAFFKYKWPDELVSNNTAQNVKQKTALKLCFHGYVRIIK